MVRNIRRLILSVANALLWIHSAMEKHRSAFVKPLNKLYIVFFVYLLGLKYLTKPVTEVGNWVMSESLMAKVSQNYLAIQQDSSRSTKEKFDASVEVSKSLVSSVATIATISGGLFVFWNIRLTQTRLITERFSRAVEQLASDKLEIRLGGIYSLERLAQDSTHDGRTIMAVLTAFVREKAPLQTNEKKYGFVEEVLAGLNKNAKFERSSSEIAIDVQAVLEVIRNRKKINRLFHFEVFDLSRTNLNNGVLIGLYLKNSLMYECNLEEAYLCKASLEGCILSDSNLKGANLAEGSYKDTNFERANLEKANMFMAIFEDASFAGSTLKDTYFVGSFLKNTNFENADISGADFRNVKYLTVQQIIKAKNWKGAKYNPYFLEQLNLLAEAEGLKP